MYFRIDRTSDDNREMTYAVHHRCEEGNRLARLSRKNVDDDVLTFYPHLYMLGMPTGVPTPVQSEDPCGACGKWVTAMFEYKSSLIIPL